MPRQATTFRIEPAVQAALQTLGKVLHRPLNSLVNEAVKDYVARRGAAAELELEGTLKKLRQYKKSDPDFSRAIADYVDAEASLEHDPAEGEPVSVKGPAESEVLRAVNG